MIKLKTLFAALGLSIAFGVTGCSDSSGGSTEPTVGEAVTDFSGQTVTIIVGYNPGGGTDTSARLLNKYLSKHLPGNPDVIVQNMTGAAGIRALNYTYEKARPNGQEVIFAPISLLVPLLGEPGIRYELDKFQVVGGLRSGPIIHIATTDLAAGPSDLAASEDIVLGGIRTSSSLDLMPRLAYDALGVDYRYVTGYSNENTVRNAIQTSEINSFGGTFSGYRSAVIPTLVEPGIVDTLWQFPYRDADGNYPRSAHFAPDIPTFMEVYEDLNGAAPSGEAWDALQLALDLRSVADNMLMAPPGTDPETLAVMREAFNKAVNDPEMIAEVTGVLGYFYQVVPTDYIETRFTESKDINEDALALIKTMIADAD